MLTLMACSALYVMWRFMLLCIRIVHGASNSKVEKGTMSQVRPVKQKGKQWKPENNAGTNEHEAESKTPIDINTSTATATATSASSTATSAPSFTSTSSPAA